MAHSLILDDLNGGTVNLNISPVTLMHYTPLSLDANADTVIDNIRLKIEDASTITSVSNNLQFINRLLRQAERFTNNGVANQVFLKYQPGGYTSAWYSPIVKAHMVIDPEATDLAQWNNKTIFFDLEIERKNYWERETSGTLGRNLSFINGSALYYQPTGTAFNSNTDGDLPSPVSLQFQIGTISNIKKIYLATWQDKSGTAGLLAGGTPVYKECEAWGTIYGGSAVADASCSQGTAYQRVLTSTTSTTIGTILTPFFNQNLGGNNVRAWMRFGTITSTNIQYQFGIRPDPTQTADSWTSPWVTPGTQDYIQDFGQLDFSGINFGSAPTVYLYSRLTSGTIGTLRLDYWILAPYDNYIVMEGLNTAGTSVYVYNGYVNGINGIGTNRIMTVARSSNATAIYQDWYSKYDEYLFVNPSQIAVFYSQAVGLNGTATPTTSWSFKVADFYPRKLNI